MHALVWILAVGGVILPNSKAVLAIMFALLASVILFRMQRMWASRPMESDQNDGGGFGETTR